MASCAVEIAESWATVVEYADPQGGEITANSLQSAFDDWQAGDLSGPRLQQIQAAYNGGCALVDAVEPTVSPTASGGVVTAAVGLDAPGGGVEATVTVTMAGAAENVTLVVGETAEVAFEADSGGDYEVCANIVSVVPA